MAYADPPNERLENVRAERDQLRKKLTIFRGAFAAVNDLRSMAERGRDDYRDTLTRVQRQRDRAAEMHANDGHGCCSECLKVARYSVPFPCPTYRALTED